MAQENVNQPSLLIFDDAGGQWGPMADLRSVMQFRTGVVKTRQRIERVIGRSAAAIWLPGRLADITGSGALDGAEPFFDAPLPADSALAGDANKKNIPTTTSSGSVSTSTSGGGGGGVAMEMYRNPGAMLKQLPSEGDWLLVNSRWIAVWQTEEVRGLPRDHALLQPNGQLVAAHVSAAMRDVLLNQLATGASAASIGELQMEHLPQRALIERPWHILESLEAALVADLAATSLPRIQRLSQPVAMRGQYPIHIAPSATISPLVVLDAQNGPIVIDHGAVISSMVVLEGPCYIGQGSTITTHAHIRPNTVIGPRCSIGGEVSHSIIHGMTNKAHAGYLGNSLVGKWVNLGADTNVSNLKNTYSTVRMQLQANQPAQETGQGKLGPLIGDYVRTAIGTRLLTGSCVGTGAMIALSSFSPKFVESFSFLTDEAAEIYRPDAFIQTARAMLERRSYKLSQVEENHLRSLMAARR